MGQLLGESVDLEVGLFNLDFVIRVLGLVLLDLLICFSFGFVKLDKEILNLLLVLLPVALPLIFVLLVSRLQFLDLVLLDFHSGVLVLFLGREVEFYVLGFPKLFLKLCELLLEDFDLVFFDDELFLGLSELVFEVGNLRNVFGFVVFELGQHLIQIINLIFLDLHVGLALVRQIRIIPFKSLQFFMNSRFLFAIHDALIFVLRYGPSHISIKFLLFQMEILLGLGQLSSNRVDHNFLLF